MSYQSRIPSDSSYLQAYGQAMYNFSYLEWGVIWTIAKLSSDGFTSIPTEKSGFDIADAFTKVIQTTNPPLADALRDQLLKLDATYRDSVSTINTLLHAHPYTTSTGSQQLGGDKMHWSIDELNTAAKNFEDAAIECNGLFYGDLAKARP